MAAPKWKQPLQRMLGKVEADAKRAARGGLYDKFLRWKGRIETRLEKGDREYGSQAPALDKPMEALLSEMKEELEDVPGWGVWAWIKAEEQRGCIESTMAYSFAMWVRLDDMQQHLKEAELRYARLKKLGKVMDMVE